MWVSRLFLKSRQTKSCGSRWLRTKLANPHICLEQQDASATFGPTREPRIIPVLASAADEDNGRVYPAVTLCQHVHRGGPVAVRRPAVRGTET